MGADSADRATFLIDMKQKSRLMDMPNLIRRKTRSADSRFREPLKTLWRFKQPSFGEPLFCFCFLGKTGRKTAWTRYETGRWTLQKKTHTHILVYLHTHHKHTHTLGTSYSNLFVVGELNKDERDRWRIPERGEILATKVPWAFSTPNLFLLRILKKNKIIKLRIKKTPLLVPLSFLSLQSGRLNHHHCYEHAPLYNIL